MENKRPHSINFEYNGKRYCLEYTRETVKQMEAAGFSPSDIAEKPMIRLEQMWAGAFMANHRKTSNTIIEAMFKEMKNREQLRTVLMDMLAETYESLIPAEDDEDQGNVEWTVT